VGYAGGTSANPDYGHIGDHTETVQVDYDPARISYTELLAVFWQSHAPTGRAWSQQYRNAVFYNDESQRRQALESKAALEQKLGKPVQTEIVPLRSFTWAEDYHQKYLLKSEHDLVRELQCIYPRQRDFDNSTAVARINGYAGGKGSREQLIREIDQLGLSERGRKLLMRLVRP
jgi:methionine-S-sulfoxide reductase